MKKITALLITAAVCISMFSCSGQGKKTKQPENITAEKMSDVSYKKSILEIPAELYQIYAARPYNGGKNFFILGSEKGSSMPVFYTADSELSVFTRLEIPEFSYGETYDIDVADDGSIITVVNEVDYGDLPAPDPNAEDYDEELYNNAAEYTLTVNKFSVEGKLVSSERVKSYSGVVDKNLWISGVITDGENIIAEIDDKYYVLGTDGNIRGELKSSSSDGEIQQFGKNSAGEILCALENDDGKLQIKKVDAEKAALEETDITYNFSESVLGRLIPGNGEYSLFLNSRTTIYGIRSDDQSIEAVFSIEESGYNPNRVRDYCYDNNGSFIIPDNGDGMDVRLRRYTQCDPSELENIPVLTVGMAAEDYFVSDFITDFNDFQNEYRIDVKYYNEETEGEEITGTEQFRADVLAGALPDILMLYNCTEICGVNMQEQGGLCDLYEFMENDEELSRDDLIPNIAEILEQDRKLYALPNLFCINAGDVAKTKFAGNIEKWNNSSYMELSHNIPGDAVMSELAIYNGDTKINRYSEFNIWDFINEENGTCSFDSEGFIEILEYCNEAPEVSETTSYDEYEIENLQLRGHYDDRIILHNMSMLGDYSYYYEVMYGRFGGEPVTLLGNRSSDDSSPIADFSLYLSFSITEASSNKELAWKFAKEFFSDQFYKENAVHNRNEMRSGFPVTESGLEIRGENELYPYGRSYEGDTGIISRFGTADENIGCLTEKEIAEVNEMIYSAKGSPFYISYSIELGNLLWEEAMRYFSGDCTAEECAEVMQSRATIFLSEHSG